MSKNKEHGRQKPKANRKTKTVAKPSLALHPPQDDVKNVMKEEKAKKHHKSKKGAQKSWWKGRKQKSLEIGGLIAAFLTLLGTSSSGFYNFFSDHPGIQIYPFSLILCLLILYVAYKLVVSLKKHWVIYILASLIVLGIAAITISLVNKKILAAELERNQGVLIPANDPMPPSVQEIIDSYPSGSGYSSSDFMALDCGGIIIITRTDARPISLLRFHGKDVLTLFCDQHHAFVSGEFFGKNGNVVSVIESNRFIINPSNFLEKQRPDESTLVVKDQQNIEVLNIRYMRRNLLKITGIIRLPDSSDLVISSNSVSHGNNFYSDLAAGGFGAAVSVEANGSLIFGKAQ